MEIEFSLARAGRWFLRSGIQDPCGGVARYYRSDIRKNKAISTEITGYTASALVYLFTATGAELFLARACQTVKFLTECAWNPALSTFPFEHPSPSADSAHRSYFFDCGIIIRGLLAVWRQTREERLLDLSRTAALAMLADFRAAEDYHPILELPEKTPVARTRHWSRSAACYQLKAAMSWIEVAELTGDESLESAYLEMVDDAVHSHGTFLEGFEPHPTMDRLHAYCYFLEALTPVLYRPDCKAAYASALASISRDYHRIAPSFARCDVLAQLLRARFYCPPSTDPGAQCSCVQNEAIDLGGFQLTSEDPRLDGGFLFARRDGADSTHVSPVSTAFALQALEMQRNFQCSNQPPCRHLLI